MTTTRLKKFLIWACVLYVAGFYGLILLNHPILKYSDIISVCGTSISIPVLAYVVSRHKPETRLPWILFLLMSALFFIGDALWAYFAHTTGDPDTPSVCDIFYISNTVVGIGAFIVYLLQSKKVNLVGLSFDVFLSAFASAGIIFIAVVLPIIHETNESMISVLVQICYPIGDILLLVIFFILFFNTTHLARYRKVYSLLGLHCLISLLADQVSLINDIYELDVGVYLDPLWGTIMPVLALAGLYDCEVEAASAKKEADPEVLDRSVLEKVRVALPYVLTFSILGYVFAQHKMTDLPSLWAISLFLLLCLRQIVVIMTNERLLLAIQKKELALNQKNQELEKLNQQVLHDSQVDFLTQLFNRRHIGEILGQLAPKGEAPEALGLLLIDVDKFKQVNDTYGHQIGDEVLHQVADWIRRTIGTTDVAGRYGGDEFIAILPKADQAAVAEAANKLLEAVRGDSDLSNRNVTLSIGGSSWKVNRADYHIEKLLKAADDALYDAKEGGRNQMQYKAVA